MGLVVLGILPKEREMMQVSDYALLPFFRRLDELSSSATPQCWIVTAYGDIGLRDLEAGFRRVAASPDKLSIGMRAFYDIYRDALSQQAGSAPVRFCRAWLVIHSNLAPSTILHAARQGGMNAFALASDAAARFPIPFRQALAPSFYHATDSDGEIWTCLQLRETQGGAVGRHAMAGILGWDFRAWVILHVTAMSRKKTDTTLRAKAQSVKEAMKSSNKKNLVEAADMMDVIEDARAEQRQMHSLIHNVDLHVVFPAATTEERREREEVVKTSLPAFSFRRAPALRIRELFDFAPLPPSGPTQMSAGTGIMAAMTLSNATPSNTAGVMVGVAPTGGPIVLDLTRSKPHAVVIGQTGSGKTFATQMMFLRTALLGSSFVMVDPQSNIRLDWLLEDCHKSTLGSDAASINPFDIIHDDPNRQIDHAKSLMRLLDCFSADAMWSVSQNVAASEALMSKYERPYSMGGVDAPQAAMPLMKHIAAYVEHQILNKADASRASGQRVRMALYDMLERMEVYTKYERAGWFGSPTTVDFNVLSRTGTIYDISRLPEAGQGLSKGVGNLRSIFLVMLSELLLSAVRRYRAHGQYDRRLNAFFDEMGILLRDVDLAQMVSAQYKTGRARGVSMWVADQSPTSLFGPVNSTQSHFGRTMLSESETLLCFNLRESERRPAREYLAFPDVYLNRLFGLGIGEGVLQHGGTITSVSFLASDFERIALSSDPRDQRRSQQAVRLMRDELLEKIPAIPHVAQERKRLR